MNTAEKLDFDETPVITMTQGKTQRERKPFRALRRYGIEVDKVEDVGVMVMVDGLYPMQSMTWEERDSLPQEVRDKAEAALHYIFENSDRIFKENIKKVLRDQLARGTPIVYGDGGKGVLKRYPDGRVYTVDTNMETFESTETFLRMATDEENARIYG